jgi:hypothetical protein
MENIDFVRDSFMSVVDKFDLERYGFNLEEFLRVHKDIGYFEITESASGLRLYDNYVCRSRDLSNLMNGKRFVEKIGRFYVPYFEKQLPKHFISSEGIDKLSDEACNQYFDLRFVTRYSLMHCAAQIKPQDYFDLYIPVNNSQMKKALPNVTSKLDLGLLEEIRDKFCRQRSGSFDFQEIDGGVRVKMVVFLELYYTYVAKVLNWKNELTD